MSPPNAVRRRVLGAATLLLGARATFAEDGAAQIPPQ
jgi:hypothetical protein